MTTDELRQAVAESLGWKFQKGTEPTYGGTNIPCGWIPPNKTRPLIHLPNYPTSLDACREGWEKDAPIEYVMFLMIETGADKVTAPSIIAEHILHATPEQRCRAWLAFCEQRKGKVI